jgi:hypothetical protein
MPDVQRPASAGGRRGPHDGSPESIDSSLSQFVALDRNSLLRHSGVEGAATVTMPFGKYSGYPISELPSDYIDGCTRRLASAAPGCVKQIAEEYFIRFRPGRKHETGTPSLRRQCPVITLEACQVPAPRESRGAWLPSGPAQTPSRYGWRSGCAINTIVGAIRSQLAVLEVIR